MSKSYTFSAAVKSVCKSAVKSGRLFVTPDLASGSVYVSDGRFMLQLSPADYAELVQPVTMRPADVPFTVGKNGGAEGGLSLDSIRRAYGGSPDRLELTSLVAALGACSARVFYNASADCVIAVNAAYLELFAHPDGCAFAGGNSFAPVTVDTGDGLKSLVMPVKLDGKIADAMKAACRALYSGQAPAPAAAKKSGKGDGVDYKRLYDGACSALDAAQAENRELSEKLARLEKSAGADAGRLAAELSGMTADRDRLAERVAALEAAAAAAAVEPAAGKETSAGTAPPQTDADYAARVKSAVERLPGVAVTVKGGCWVWIDGDTKPAAEALKSMGCRWSQKRSAWYWSPSCKRGPAPVFAL